MTIGAFAMLTFGQAQNWKANEAANTLADMEEWMNEDIANGRIDQELGQEYIDNLQNVVMNTVQSQSRIVDADFSIETTNLTRNTVLQQAATSMLAQANAQKNSVLALIQQ